MKRKISTHSDLLYYTIFYIVVLLVVFLLIKLYVHIPLHKNIPVSPYVRANGTQLTLNGQPFQFTGINAFNIGGESGINAGCGATEDNLDALFSQLRPNSVVRMWAFQGSITTNVRTKQIDWVALDRVVATAKKDRIKLDLVLGDQSGTCDDGHWKDQSWYAGGYTHVFNDYGNGLTPLPYLDYVTLIVSRYKNSSTIAMWEPMNEPQAADCHDAQGSACYSQLTCNEPTARVALRTFFDTVGGTIKSIDPNHLVGSGVIGSGQCGAQYEDYQYLHESSGIDVASYHDYGSDNQPMPGNQFNGLQKRLNQMKLINKPLIVGEVGIQAAENNSSCTSFASRAVELKAKMDAQFKAGIAGIMPWALSDQDSPTCNYDIGPSDPLLRLLHNYPVSMQNATSSSTGPAR